MNRLPKSCPERACTPEVLPLDGKLAVGYDGRMSVVAQQISRCELDLRIARQPEAPNEGLCRCRVIMRAQIFLEISGELQKTR